MRGGKQSTRASSPSVLAERTGLEIKFWDERLTTVEAQRVLRESGISIAKRARAVDRLAAVILLESYLDSEAGA